MIWHMACTVSTLQAIRHCNVVVFRGVLPLFVSVSESEIGLSEILYTIRNRKLDVGLKIRNFETSARNRKP